MIEDDDMERVKMFEDLDRYWNEARGLPSRAPKNKAVATPPAPPKSRQSVDYSPGLRQLFSFGFLN